MLAVKIAPLLVSVWAVPVDELPTLSDQQFYQQQCGVCHQADGWGVPFMQPALVESPRVMGDAEITLKMIFLGSAAIPEGTSEYDNQMPSFSGLKDEEIARLASYIRRTFGNQPDPVSVDAVKRARLRYVQD